MKKYIISHQTFIKFLFSGGSAAIVEYGVFVGFQTAHLSVYIANIVSFCSGLIVSYILNRLWVFKSNNQPHKEFFTYVCLAMFNLLLTTILIGILTRSVGINPFVVKLVLMITIAVWNYLLFSKLIFKAKSFPG